MHVGIVILAVSQLQKQQDLVLHVTWQQQSTQKYLEKEHRQTENKKKTPSKSTRAALCI